MKTGLVLEGGAMRGLFTAGILDIFMENGVRFDGIVGVSAGAVFGCNYKSGQAGRIIRYNKKYCRDPRYASLLSLLFTGDMYGREFCYHRLPEELDVFDRETFRKDPAEFYAVSTDADTGEAVYHKCENGDREDLEWIRASASMPLVSHCVCVGGRRLLDGGSADSIPIRFFEGLGYEHNVVILTRPLGFVKEPPKWMPLMRISLRKLPGMLEAVRTRHLRYNDTLAYLAEEEARGQTLVIRPEAPLNIGSVSHSPKDMERVYQLGRLSGEKNLSAVRQYLAK